MMVNTCSGEKFFAVVTFVLPNGQKMKAMPNPDILSGQAGPESICSDAGVPVRTRPLPRPEVAAAGCFHPQLKFLEITSWMLHFFL